MQVRQTNLEELTTQAVDYLQKLSFSETRTGHYLLVWNKLAVFMKKNKFHKYDADVGHRFIHQITGEKSYNALNLKEKDMIQCVNSLTEFQQTGTIKLRKRKRCSDFQGALGATMEAYISYRKSIFIGQCTIEQDESFLYRFFIFLSDNNM